MALEDLTGTNKYIANLVNTNPLSADDRREGDDHIRGIKNVLLNTFGALSGPVDLGQYVKKAGDIMTGELTAPAFVLPGGTAYFKPGGSGYVINFGAGWLWDYNAANGTMRWLRASGGKAFTLESGGGVNLNGGKLTQEGDFYLDSPPGARQINVGVGWVQQWNTANGDWDWLAPTANLMKLRGDQGGLVVGKGTGYKPGGGAWADASDARIKDRIADYLTGLDAILALRPRTYHFREETGRDPATVYTGLIAQEAAGPMPEMVTTAPGELGELKFSDMRTLDSTPLVYALVNAVKTLAARVEALEDLCAGIGDA